MFSWPDRDLILRITKTGATNIMIRVSTLLLSALTLCLFALAATDESISTAEESEIHRIANELRIDHPDLVKLRVAHTRYLPGLSRE